MLRLAAIVESSRDAIISLTPNGILDTWNAGAEQLYGYSVAEAIGQPISMLIPPCRHGEEASILDRVRRGEKVDRYETQRLAKDGSLVDISLTLSPIKDARGEMIGISAVGHDIRDQKQAEAARSRLVQRLNERVKELTLMHRVAHLLHREEGSSPAILQELAALLPPAWMYPELAAARIQLGELEVRTPAFEVSRWSQQAAFTATDGRPGIVEVVYLAERPSAAEGPFLGYERKLLESVAVALKAWWERKRLESAILEISEREKRRIGQDLHDGISQQLRGIAYLSHSLHERLAEQSRPEVADSARIMHLLDETVDQARALARGLFPVEPDTSGLARSLRALTARVRAIYGVACRFECPGPVLVYDNPTAIHLFRIAQEAVNNAIRHGTAQRIVIRLSETKEVVRLIVRDNGKGFPPTLPKNRGMGLEIMKYRARTIGARLNHKPNPKGGTVLECILPLGDRPGEQT